MDEQEQERQQDAPKLVTGIVPSLRADVLGARAFGVSRSYFAKGIASGSVSIGGRPAGKSATVDPGETVSARELGSFELLSVDGTTKRGNFRVSLGVRRD
ncbi:MAG TPA: hypothetical protein VK092_07250 [Deinococcales bacterium]|nr:hypothetical protein [Deinococcales bacterium]